MRGLWQWLIDLPGPVLGGVVLVGTVLTALGSFLVLARQSRISEGIRTQVEANLGRTEENLKHTQAAIRAIEHAIGGITGGDNYCYILPTADAGTNELMFAVRVEGPAGKWAYPLYDVTAEILDMDKDEQAGPPSTFAERQSRWKLEDLRNLSPEFVRYIPNWRLTPGAAGRYTIRFFSRNGTFTQNLRVRMAGDRWVTASRVVRRGTVIEGSERIHPDFLDEHGQVQW